MRLTRRDALAALATTGTVGVGAALGGRSPPVASEDVDDSGLDDDGGAEPAGTESGPGEASDVDPVETLVAVSEVLYPGAVTGHREFVSTYAAGRLTGPGADEGLVRTVTDLEAVARDWHAAPFSELAPETRDRLLRDLGVDIASPDPDGNLTDRLRHHVVNDLLFALYASPTGGRLVGIENPIGYPGGTRSYRRGPEAVDAFAESTDSGGDP